jgi:hypothetical protein
MEVNTLSEYIEIARSIKNDWAHYNRTDNVVWYRGQSTCKKNKKPFQKNIFGTNITGNQRKQQTFKKNKTALFCRSKPLL